MRSGTAAQTLSGHKGFVRVLTMCPDGRLASGSVDKTIKLWDLSTGKDVQTLTGHSEAIFALTVCADGRLASGSLDKTIKLWEFPLLQSVHQSVDNQTPGASAPADRKAEIIKRVENTGQRSYQPSEQQFSAVYSTPAAKFIPRSSPPAVPASSVAATSATTELTEILNRANTCYENGDYAEAVKLYRKAAIRGDATAEKRVATLEELLAKVKTASSAPEKEEKATPEDEYKKGEKYFGKKDYEKAKRYYKRAAKEKHTGAEARLKEIERLMSSLSIPAGQSINLSSSSLTPPVATCSPAPDRLVDDAGKMSISIAIDYQELTIGRELGKGAYGVVYQGEYNFSPVAIKKLLNQDLKPSVVEEFKQEVTIMANLRFPHVVQLLGASFQKSQYALVMEYLPRGSLFNLLQNEEPISWQVRYQIGVDVGCGLAYLHKQNIIHADLKSLNVLLDKDYRAKISDFGLSKVKSTSSVSTLMGASSGGSTRWMAPELFKGAKSTKASDVFSYGVVLWELGARKIPFADNRNEAVSHLVVVEGKREEITPDTPPVMARLIAKCWEGRAEQRPNMDDAVKTLREYQEEIESTNEVSSRPPQPAQSSTTDSKIGSQYRDNVVSGPMLLKPPGKDSAASQTNSAAQSEYRGNVLSRQP